MAELRYRVTLRDAQSNTDRDDAFEAAGVKR
jgi:hypothetical protein